jgi:hypothetical protein
MKLTPIIAVLLLSAPAYAGSFNPALEDPTVIAPHCVWFGFIPCHVGFDYDEPEGNEPRDPLSEWMRSPEPEPEPQPEPQPEPKGKCK